MSDIFISYKHEEQVMAKKLADALQKKGWTVWWDPELRTGERFNDAIERALNVAKCVIVIWSKLSVNSRYVRDEATYALDRNKLLPVAIEKVDLPFRFEGIQTEQLIDWDGSDSFPGFQKLVTDIANFLVAPPVELEKRKRKDRVFFAYVFPYAKYIRSMAAELEKRGFSVEYLDSEMWAIPDATWKDEFLSRLRNSDLMIVAIFKEKPDSDPLYWEVEQAIKHGIPVLPILFGKQPIPQFLTRIAPDLSCLQAGSRGLSTHHFNEVEKAINRLLRS